MPELPRALLAVQEASERLEEANARADEIRREARDELRDALRTAHEGGASYALLGRIMGGVSRQYVARLIADE